MRVGVCYYKGLRRAGTNRSPKEVGAATREARLPQVRGCCGARPSPGITGSDAGHTRPTARVGHGRGARRAGRAGARAEGRRTDVGVAEFPREVRGDEHEVVVVDPDEVALLVRLDHRLRDRAVHLAVRRPARLLPLHRVPAARRLPVRRRRPRRRRVPPRHAGQLRLVVGADRRHRRRVVHVDHVVHHRPQRALAEPLVEAVGEAGLVVHAHAREAGRRDRLLDGRALGLGHEALGRADEDVRRVELAHADRQVPRERGLGPPDLLVPRRRPPALAVALEVDGEHVGDHDDAGGLRHGGERERLTQFSAATVRSGPRRDEARDRAVHSCALE